MRAKRKTALILVSCFVVCCFSSYFITAYTLKSMLHALEYEKWEFGGDVDSKITFLDSDTGVILADKLRRPDLHDVRWLYFGTDVSDLFMSRSVFLLGNSHSIEKEHSFRIFDEKIYLNNLVFGELSTSSESEVTETYPYLVGNYGEQSVVGVKIGSNWLLNIYRKRKNSLFRKIYPSYFDRIAELSENH